MLVKDCKPGQVIQIAHCGQYTGTESIYRIDSVKPVYSERLQAWKPYRQGKCMIHGRNTCRIVPQSEIDILDLQF